MHARTRTVEESKVAQEKRSLSASLHDVQKLVERRLRNSSYAPIRRVSFNYHEGVLILRGRVPSYYLKQIAQTLVRNVKGVDVVVNRLVVDD